MVHPSYQLNPGDMFQVDVEKVMYGTGQQKAAGGNKRLRENLEARKKRADAVYAAAAAKKDAPAAAEPAEGGRETAAGEGEAPSPEEAWKANNRALKFLLKDVKKILKNNPKELTAREKKQLRLFRADAKRFLSHPGDADADARQLMDELQLHMDKHELLRESFDSLSLGRGDDEAGAAPQAQAQEQGQRNRKRETDKGLEGLSEEQKEKALRIMGPSQLSRDEMRSLGRLLKYDEENPIDDAKPYATPWRPRPFMSAFAFIPRYLEVNPNICAAVYLRHPVARKGMAEVPTPFGYLTSQLAHNWYLERG